MEIIDNRIQSYYKKGWPHLKNPSYPSIEQFAYAGFYFCPDEGWSDGTECYLCHKQLDGWEPTDNPWNAHITHGKMKISLKNNEKEFHYIMKNAKYLIRNNGIIENDPVSGSHFYISCPLVSLELEPCRYLTFSKGWKKSGINYKANPATLAKAGFFFSPKLGSLDMTICYQCGTGLDEWALDDDPYIEHKKRNPDCAHLLETPRSPYFFQQMLSYTSDETKKKKKVKKETEKQPPVKQIIPTDTSDITPGISLSKMQSESQEMAAMENPKPKRRVTELERLFEGHSNILSGIHPVLDTNNMSSRQSILELTKTDKEIKMWRRNSRLSVEKLLSVASENAIHAPYSSSNNGYPIYQTPVKNSEATDPGSLINTVKTRKRKAVNRLTPPPPPPPKFGKRQSSILPPTTLASKDYPFQQANKLEIKALSMTMDDKLFEKTDSKDKTAKHRHTNRNTQNTHINIEDKENKMIVDLPFPAATMTKLESNKVKEFDPIACIKSPNTLNSDEEESFVSITSVLSYNTLLSYVTKDEIKSGWEEIKDMTIREYHKWLIDKKVQCIERQFDELLSEYSRKWYEYIAFRTSMSNK